VSATVVLPDSLIVRETVTAEFVVSANTTLLRRREVPVAAAGGNVLVEAGGELLIL
jgi:hypothetical protein